MKRYDVIVIGGGQSGLAVGYYLRRTGLSYIILDNQKQSGGAWLHTWKSLRLFSPAQWSSLPGMIMHGGSHQYPDRNETIAYLNSYEHKYNLPVERPVDVIDVRKRDNEFEVETSQGLFYAKTIVSATGSFSNAFIPPIKGMDLYRGQILHSSEYTSADDFINKRVAIVGEGNSGAQILAEVSKITETIWITQKEPRFLPDHIDGRYLFDAATQQYEAQKQGKEFKPPSLGDIVMVDSVKEARSRNVLNAVRPFDYVTNDSLIWADGRVEKVDVVIFCTGFRASLGHLKSLQVSTSSGKVDTTGTKAKTVEGLWLVGYGSWTGFASATLIGVGRTAKATVDQVSEYILSQQRITTP